MKKCPPVLILRTAGTNCDRETAQALEGAGATPDLRHISEFFQNPAELLRYYLMVIPGGFSYGDDIASGRLFANELRFRLHDVFQRFLSEQRLILGICNGFQVLVKAGILPDSYLFPRMQGVTLTYNRSGKFECRWVYLRVDNSPSIFTAGLPSLITLPVAHAEGRFLVQAQNILFSLQEKQQIVFRYVNSTGDEADYPANPNGSVAGIAGLTNPQGTILGLMPHPERFAFPEQHPRWLRPESSFLPWGRQIFQNAVEYLRTHF